MADWWECRNSTPNNRRQSVLCQVHENIHTIKTMVVCLCVWSFHTYIQTHPSRPLSLPTSLAKDGVGGQIDRYPSMACLYKFCQPQGEICWMCKEMVWVRWVFSKMLELCKNIFTFLHTLFIWPIMCRLYVSLEILRRFSPHNLLCVFTNL